MNVTGITDNALAELLSTKKGDDYSTTMSRHGVRAKASFALPRSALLTMRGSRGTRNVSLNITDNDFEYELIIFFHN